MPDDKDASFKALFESSPNRGRARQLRLGDVLDVEVVRVGAKEVFVALDGKQEGFIEAGALRDADGKPTVSMGSRIAARVTAIDRETGSVELTPLSPEPIVTGVSESPEGAKAAAPDNAVVTGMRVKGKVAGVERYGVFLSFEVPGKSRPERGLIPAAELGVPRGADLRKAFPVGKELEAAVTAIDERGRIRLSVTAMNAAEEQRAFRDYTDRARPEANKGEKKPVGFGTFADLLKRGK
ncbi:MAG TPA: S1 RNA-binding domain-containing protein [Polyangiaceae bacterium]|jgi:small subunit ribosomal protein S1|nr:S1 RNA-binding domain-containing protein [Polyangiaceae bacterium]